MDTTNKHFLQSSHTHNSYHDTHTFQEKAETTTATRTHPNATHQSSAPSSPMSLVSYLEALRRRFSGILVSSPIGLRGQPARFQYPTPCVPPAPTASTEREVADARRQQR